MKTAVLAEIINSHSGSRAPLEIAKSLAQQKMEVKVYAYSHMLDPLIKNDLLKHQVSIKTFKKTNIAFIGRCLAALKLYKTLKKDRPQIITYAGTFPFFFAAVLTKIPIVRIYLGTQYNAYLEKKIPGEKITITDKILNDLANTYIYIIEIITTLLSKGIIAISDYTKLEAERLYFKKVDRVVYLATTPLKTTNKNGRKSFTFISVSRITPYKGFHKLINALSKVKTNKNIRLAIVGSQPQKNYLTYLQKIGGKKLKIFLDVSDSELANLYQSSQIYLNADINLFFGLPILEAAHYRLPTISFDYGAAKELISHDKTGFIAKNEKDFVKYIATFLKNPSLIKTLGENAKCRSDEFSWQKTGKLYKETFEKILK